MIRTNKLGKVKDFVWFEQKKLAEKEKVAFEKYKEIKTKHYLISLELQKALKAYRQAQKDKQNLMSDKVGIKWE